jgi:hypothetical protein
MKNASRDIAGMSGRLALFNERLGPEDKDAWREHAPEKAHPSVDTEDDQ